MINGKYRQVMLSARELNTENMPNRSWVNERLTFTHGYGLTLGPVNQVTTEGLPVLFIRDLPPVSTVDCGSSEPSIYFGELSSSYVLVRTQPAGVPLSARATTTRRRCTRARAACRSARLWRRLLFAIRFATTDILVTNQITPDSRILFHRRIGERVQIARAVPAVRRGSLSGRQRRPAVLDPGRVHDDGELSVLDARRRRSAATSTTSATR